MISKYKFDLNRVKMNRYAKCTGQRSFRTKIVVQTHKHTHTHTTDLVLYVATNVICKSNVNSN